ncbi:hypothetical protein [Halobacillus sp. H74]|uniref:hypothetical protein n=1 Tax=Halobacillus sp. H74 TaxID=3457436 RepID=UPI003FCE6906
MKPKIKPNVVYWATEEGVAFKGNNGVSILKGKNIYPLMRKLVPFLDGYHSLEELTSNSSDVNANAIKRIIIILLDKGFIYDYLQDESKLSKAIIERFSSEISFIHSYVQNPERTFEEYRNSRLLIIGQSKLVFSTVWGLINTGSKYIDYSLTNEPENSDKEDFYKKLSNDVFLHKNADLNKINIDSTEPNNYDLVLYLQAHKDNTNLNDINTKNRFENVNFIPILYCDDGALIGPIPENHCWKCVRNRSEELLGDINSDYINEETKVIYLSNSVSFEVFKYLTKIETYEKTNVVLLRFDDFTQEQIYVPQVKGCNNCTRTINGKLMLENHYLDTSETYNDKGHRELFIEKALNCVVGERTGILRKLSFEDKEQLPIQKCAVSLCGKYSDHQIEGIGVNHKDAMYNALIKGLESYAHQESVNRNIRNLYQLNNQEIHLNQEVASKDFVFAIGHSSKECFNNGIGNVEVIDIVTNGRMFHKLTKKELKIDGDIQIYLSIINKFLNGKVEFIEFDTKYPISLIGLILDGRLWSVTYHKDRQNAALKAVIQSINKLQNPSSKPICYYRDLRAAAINYKNSSKDTEIVFIPWKEDIYLLESLQLKILGFKVIDSNLIL